MTGVTGFSGRTKDGNAPHLASFGRSCSKFWLGLFLVLQTATAFAQELPDAIHVREQIDQEIEFQDKVEAVSYSRSTHGYYLSFGAPFPAQVLSVWMSRKVYHQLPWDGALVGRNVRIKGWLEASPTGPLVKLEAREAVEVLPVAEAALSKEVLDGKMDRDQFRAAIFQKFEAEDFGTLEVLAEELRQSRERFSDGGWLAETYFSAFGIGSRSSEAAYAAWEQRIAHWEIAHPGSLIALLVRAGYHRDLAWHHRSAKIAKKVKPEQWAGFKSELATARALLESHPAAKMYPEYFSILQSIALGQNWEKDDYLRLFAEATNAEPDYYKFYFKVAQYLLPRWHGHKGDWEAFAETQRQRRGPGAAGDGLYARIAWEMKAYSDFKNSAMSWDVIASGFEFLIREDSQSRWLKNSYANFAWKMRDRERLRAALPAVRNEPDMNIWVNLENLALAERFVETRQ